jgi:hypothetical protein
MCYHFKLIFVHLFLALYSPSCRYLTHLPVPQKCLSYATLSKHILYNFVLLQACLETWCTLTAGVNLLLTKVSYRTHFKGINLNVLYLFKLAVSCIDDTLNKSYVRSLKRTEAESDCRLLGHASHTKLNRNR